MNKIKFTEKNEKTVNDVLKIEDQAQNERLKMIGEKFVICAGALAITHGVLAADVNSFNVGLIIETAGITALQCSQLESDKLEENRKLLIRTFYHRK